MPTPETELHEDDAPCCIAYVTSGRRDHVPGCPELVADTPAPIEPGELFTKLVREVDAGRALLAMTEPHARRRAAIDALALCRDLLTDARDLFGSCACGAVQLDAAELGASHVVGDLAHAPAACVRIDELGEQL